MNLQPIPVTLLTGFLGSGKTTLLGQILRDPRFSDTAVIINEFGEIGLDHVLVETSREDLVQMTSGCLCCTVRGDIRRTLLSLHQRMEEGSVPTFSRVIVETTGLADPAPVLHTLMSDQLLWPRYTLGGVVTTVDAVNGEATLRRQVECVKQLAVADRIVLTKTDLASDPASLCDIDALRRTLGWINPGASVIDRRQRGFDVRTLFDTGLYDPAGKGLDVQRWLNDEAVLAEEQAAHQRLHAHPHDPHRSERTHDHELAQRHHHKDHTHGDHDGPDDAAHDVNRHGPDIRAFCIVRDDPLPALGFTLALDLLIANRGEDLLRVKGILNIAEEPERPCVIHGVQHIFHEPLWLDRWPTADRRSRIVFITRNLSREVIEPLLAAFSGLLASSGTATVPS